MLSISRHLLLRSRNALHCEMFVAFAKIFVDSGKLDYNLRPSSGELLLMYMQSKSFVSACSAVKLKLYMHWHVT